MTTLDLAVNRLQVEEGFRSVVYRDAVGAPTVGYGCNLDAGLTRYAATALLTAQVSELIDQLNANDWFAASDPVRQSVFVDVAFNVGYVGLMKFTNMIAAAQAKNWTVAAAALLDSSAARLNVARYHNLAAILASGADPPLIET